MSQVETMRVQSWAKGAKAGEAAIINRDDFDPSIHKALDGDAGKAESAASNPAKKKPASKGSKAAKG